MCVSSPSLPAVAAQSGPESCSAGQPSATSKTTIIAKESSDSASETGSSMTPQYSAISEHSSVRGTPIAIRAWLMSLRRDSPVSPLALPAEALANSTRATCGQRRLSAFAEYDRATHCWRTFQGSLLNPTSDEYSETWPKRFTISRGIAYRLRRSARRTVGIASGLSLPTPTAGGHTQNKSPPPGAALRPTLVGMARGNLWPTPQSHDSAKGNAKRVGRHGTTHGGRDLTDWVQLWPTPGAHETSGGAAKPRPGHQVKLKDAVKHWPTPRASDYKGSKSAAAAAAAVRSRNHDPNLPELVAESVGGGQLNPEWVEWLMGWPIGATGLGPLEMDKFQLWLQQHSSNSQDSGAE